MTINGKIETITFSKICSFFPKRKIDSHKGNFGKLLCITGSQRMPGAAAMSSYAALRSGVGLLTTATAEQNISSLSSQCFESMYLPLKTDLDGFITWNKNEELIKNAVDKSDAILLGCGLGITEETILLTKNIIKNTRCPLILDADGLNAIADSINIISERENPIILTPHPGEMARLLKISIQEVQNNRTKVIHDTMKLLPKAIIVLKGHETLVGYNGSIYKNPTGNPGMSRGGSGDVLAGMIAAFTAQRLSPVEAALAGVYIHGMAGDIAAQIYSQSAMLPRDIIECIPKVFLKIEDNRQINDVKSAF